MVCKDCEKKLSRVICPDKWKDGARNTTESGGRIIGENKLLSAKKRWTPFDKRCLSCKQTLTQDGKYCHTCAYAKGFCAMCGKKAVDISAFKMSEGGPKNWDESQAVKIGPNQGGEDSVADQKKDGEPVKKKVKKKVTKAEPLKSAGTAAQVAANAWVWDSQTNYYYSAAGYYFDPNSKHYYDIKGQKWLKEIPTPASTQVAANFATT